MRQWHTSLHIQRSSGFLKIGIDKVIFLFCCKVLKIIELYVLAVTCLIESLRQYSVSTSVYSIFQPTHLTSWLVFFSPINLATIALIPIVTIVWIWWLYNYSVFVTLSQASVVNKRVLIKKLHAIKIVLEASK